MMADPLHIASVQAHVVRDGRFLMVVRSESEQHAPGALSPPGGTVEHGEDAAGVLEDTLRREVLEESGVVIGEMAYLRSSRFTTDRGTPVVDTAFLCQYRSGEAHAADPDEVAGAAWLTAEEIQAHPRAEPWTLAAVRAAEALRLRLGW